MLKILSFSKSLKMRNFTTQATAVTHSESMSDQMLERAFYDLLVSHKYVWKIDSLESNYVSTLHKNMFISCSASNYERHLHKKTSLLFWSSALALCISITSHRLQICFLWRWGLNTKEGRFIKYGTYICMIVSWVAGVTSSWRFNCCLTEGLWSSRRYCPLTWLSCKKKCFRLTHWTYFHIQSDVPKFLFTFSFSFFF